MAATRRLDEDGRGEWLSKVPQVTLMFWVIKIFATTLGETGGDAVTMTWQLGYAVGLGFERGALVFSGLIALVAVAHYFTKISDSVLFWAAYVLTRPLGATLGDTLTKPHDEGRLDLSRITSSVVIAAIMVIMIYLTYRRAARVSESTAVGRA